MNKQPGIYSTAEAAALLGVSTRTIRRYIKAGRLAGAYKPNNSRRIGWRVSGQALSVFVPLEQRGQLLSQMGMFA